jgi:hypothetical protein
LHPDPAIFSSLAIDMETITAWLRTTDLPPVPVTFALSASEDAKADQITLSCTGGSII